MQQAASATPTTIRSSDASVEPATFTGQSGDRGYDADGNGLFEQLEVDVELDVTRAGAVALVATLRDAKGESIAMGSLDPQLQRAAPATNADLRAGRQAIPIYFNGRNIRRHGVDGPYTVEVALLGERGPGGRRISLATEGYRYQQFQAELVEIQALSDRGVDADGIPGYELLRVSAQVNVLGAGEVTAQGELFRGESLLGSVSTPLVLRPGVRTVDLDFAAEPVWASNLEGPYRVYLSFHDAYYDVPREYTTAAYHRAELQTPVAFFTGKVTDDGLDANGDGLYEELAVSAEVSARVPASYTIHGVLEDQSGGFIAATDVTLPLDATPRPARLAFPGLTIGHRAIDGPYRVRMAIVDADGRDLMGAAHVTGAYRVAGFRGPGAVFSGALADEGVDTDGDGLYNVLRVTVGLTVSQTGTYTVEGSLLDGGGRFITGARTRQYLAAGKRSVSLDFGGLTIRLLGADGPYRLVAVDLTEEGVGGVDSIFDDYRTRAYRHTSFKQLAATQSQGARPETAPPPQDGPDRAPPPPAR